MSPKKTPLLFALLLAACGGQTVDKPKPPETVAVLAAPSRSTTIDITGSDQRVAAVNPDTDSLTLIDVASSAKVGSVPFTPGAQPASVVFHPDEKTAFVVLRHKQRLARVEGIDGAAPTVAAEFTTGSEPTGVALSPTGALAVVANFGDEDVSVINTTTGEVKARVAVGGHPRAVVISNNGDQSDADEKAYVTIFYGVAIGAAEQSEGTDSGRKGQVVEISLGSLTKTGTFDLLPIANLPAVPLAGNPVAVGCVPNQLYSIALAQGRLYVPHVCASPAGPLNANGNLFAAVSVIDLAIRAERTAAGGTAALNPLVDAQSGGTTASLLGVPVAIDFHPDSKVAYLASLAGDVVQRIVYSDTDPLQPVRLGDNNRFKQIPLGGSPQVGGKAPTGIVLAHKSERAFVNNEVSRDISILDLNQQVEQARVQSEPLPAAGSDAEKVLLGKRFFLTGTGRWAKRSVSSCVSCHTDGLSDGITWSFPAGPRRSTPLDGTFSKKSVADQRMLNWTATRDEVHDFELNTRAVSFGTGALVVDAVVDIASRIDITLAQILDGNAPLLTRNDDLSGSTKQVTTLKSAKKDWDAIERYVQTIRSNRAPTTLDTAAVERGRALFATANCTGCHGGDKWTVSRLPYVPSQAKNGSAAGKDATGAAVAPSGLRLQPLTVPAGLAALNGETRKVAVEVLDPNDATKNRGPERVTCVLRKVGTFDNASPLEKKVVTDAAPAGAPAQGIGGFNPPSLLGMPTAGPYLHHGAVRSVKDLFAAEQHQHHQAFAQNFLQNGGSTPEEQQQIADLTAFVLSIDGDTVPFAIPTSPQGDMCDGY